MYAYTEEDRRVVQERVNQFRGQVRRRLAGELTEEQFLPLRLMNGLYRQRHAYMLRIAVPYGLLSSRQVRTLAHIARTWDQGWGHFTTRQNIQFNWPRLEDVPDILQALADVEMHAIQTSGNCIRNVTADHLAGVADDELVDPRPWCEILRQWSTFHPEFSFLPRKFKIAVTGATTDRAAVALHDIGFRVLKNDQGEIGFQVIVGGGMGRTPVVGQVIHPFLPERHLLSYTEAILRVYNLFGHRDNKFKARIKILVRELGIDAFRTAVEQEWAWIRDSALTLDPDEVARIRAHFPPMPWRDDAPRPGLVDSQRAADPAFDRWVRRNVKPHRAPGHHVVMVSLKSPNRPPGDITADQLDAVADLADRFSFGEVRSTHDQNLVLAHVEDQHLHTLWTELGRIDLATPNIGTLTDLIACPGLDYCSLANAGSIAVARQITDRFDDFDHLYDIGDLQLKMSGCINACGHHHVGHIGILGINKNDEEYYQITIGGSPGDDAALGKVIGPAVAQARVADALERLLHVYVTHRTEEERFLDTVRRLGVQPFKEAVYAHHP